MAPSPEALVVSATKADPQCQALGEDVCVPGTHERYEQHKLHQDKTRQLHSRHAALEGAAVGFAEEGAALELPNHMLDLWNKQLVQLPKQRAK